MSSSNPIQSHLYPAGMVHLRVLCLLLSLPVTRLGMGQMYSTMGHQQVWEIDHFCATTTQTWPTLLKLYHICSGV
jgi:hypothetical protein